MRGFYALYRAVRCKTHSGNLPIRFRIKEIHISQIFVWASVSPCFARIKHCVVGFFNERRLTIISQFYNYRWINTWINRSLNTLSNEQISEQDSQAKISRIDQRKIPSLRDCLLNEHEHTMNETPTAVLRTVWRRKHSNDVIKRIADSSWLQGTLPWRRSAWELSCVENKHCVLLEVHTTYTYKVIFIYKYVVALWSLKIWDADSMKYPRFPRIADARAHICITKISLMNTSICYLPRFLTYIGSERLFRRLH